jgi:hypothetical protein
VYLSPSQAASANPIKDDRTDLEGLATKMVEGGFPENYDYIIRGMSDDDFERLWEFFNRERTIRAKGGDKSRKTIATDLPIADSTA